MNYKILYIFLIVFQYVKAEIQPVLKKQIVIAKSGLTIRNRPSLGGNKIGKLLYEHIVEVIKVTDKVLELKDGENLITGSWVEIKIPKTNKKGYVFDGYLKDLKDNIENMNHHFKYTLQNLVLKEFPKKDTIQYKNVSPSYILNKKEWQELGFNILYEFEEASYIKHSIYNVVNVEFGFVLFVERHHDNEGFHWLCFVDNNLKLKDKICIAYSNAEGFTGTETYFKDAKINIDIYNIYETPEEQTKTYQIEKFHFKQIID